MKGSIDFLKADESEIKKFITDLKFDPAPDSNLIVKKSILKREGGAFGGMKESTALFTRDK